MNRIICILVLLVAPIFIVDISVVGAKTPRIGFLASSSGDRLKSRIGGFEQGLRDFGYIAGKNITIDYLSAEGRFDRLPQLVNDLIKSPIDVIVAEGAPAAHAAKNATSVIPIVIGNAADPVRTGLVASLAKPGGNLTGLSDFNLGVITKRLEIVKDVVPAANRFAILWNPGNPTNPIQLEEISKAAPGLGVGLVAHEARTPAEIDRALAAIQRDRFGALIVFGDPMFGTYQRRITDWAIKVRLPAIYGASESVDAGGLMSYGTNFSDLYRRAANYVDKILKGAKPADLPIEQPTKFEHAQLFCRKKANRRARHQTSLAGYLQLEGHRRCGRAHVLRSGLRRPTS